MDRFMQPILYLPGSDLFVVIDEDKIATDEDFVAISRGDQTTIEPFYGQKHCGVIVVMDFYKLEHSQQWTPQNREGLKGA